MLSRNDSVILVCDLLGCARRTYTYQGKERDETELQAAVAAVAAGWATCGYRRITAQLRRQGWGVNRKRVCRLMREMGLQAKTERRRRKTTNSERNFPRHPKLVPGLEIVRRDQI